MATVRELITKLGFNVDESGLKKAERGIASIKGAAIGLAAVFTGIGTGLFALAKSAANAGDEIRKGSQKIGLSVEAYQKLGYAAELSDVSTEQLSTGIGLLSKKLIDASEGGKESAEAFKKLGLSVKDSSGKMKSTDVIFGNIADKFKSMPDGAAKSALAMEVFGKAGKEMIPLLNGGSAAIKDAGDQLEAFNGIITDDQTKNAEIFNDNITSIMRFIGGLKNTIGNALIPIFNDLTGSFIKWAEANKDVIKTEIDYWAKELTETLKEMVRWGKEIYSWTKDITKKLGGLENILKAVALGFAVFTAGKILAGVNSIIGGIRALSIAIGIFKAVALWEIYLIIAVIALVAAAIYLIYDDVKAWLEGRPNMFGSIYQWAVDTAKWLKEVWDEFINFMKNLWIVFKADVWPILQKLGEIFIAPYKMLVKQIGDALTWIEKVVDGFLKLIGVGETLSSIFEKLKLGAIEGFGATIDAKIAGVNLLKDGVNNRANEIQTEQGASALSSATTNQAIKAIQSMNKPPAAIGNTQNNKTQNNEFQIQQKVEVTVQNPEASAIGEKVKEATRSELDKSLRAAARALEGAVS